MNVFAVFFRQVRVRRIEGLAINNGIFVARACVTMNATANMMFIHLLAGAKAKGVAAHD